MPLSLSLCCLDLDTDEVEWHFSPSQSRTLHILQPLPHHIGIFLSPYFLIVLSLSLSTVHKICLSVISPPTQENNERQWHDRLDIDEIAAVTICTARLGPGFATEMEKGVEGVGVWEEGARGAGGDSRLEGQCLQRWGGVAGGCVRGKREGIGWWVWRFQNNVCVCKCEMTVSWSNRANWPSDWVYKNKRCSLQFEDAGSCQFEEALWMDQQLYEGWDQADHRQQVQARRLSVLPRWPLRRGGTVPAGNM